MTEETFLEKFYRENLESFRTQTIHELINKFNHEVGCKGWTGTRGVYLGALGTAFDEISLKEGIVLDKEVFQYKSTSYKRKIKLRKNHVVPQKSFTWRSIWGK